MAKLRVDVEQLLIPGDDGGAGAIEGVRGVTTRTDLQCGCKDQRGNQCTDHQDNADGGSHDQLLLHICVLLLADSLFIKNLIQ